LIHFYLSFNTKIEFWHGFHGFHCKANGLSTNPVKAGLMDTCHPIAAEAGLKKTCARFLEK